MAEFDPAAFFAKQAAERQQQEQNTRHRDASRERQERWRCLVGKFLAELPPFLSAYPNPTALLPTCLDKQRVATAFKAMGDGLKADGLDWRWFRL